MKFADIYDKFMEYVDYEEWYNYIMDYINKKNINVSTVLEIGCGTGEFLKLFKQENYNIIGVDISDDMLSIAEDKISKVKGKSVLLNQNMIFLDSGRKNDLIVSFFDTINYLLTEEELHMLFQRVEANLSKEGIFIFDIATRELMQDMFKNGIYYDDRENMTVIWEHYYNRGTKLDEINISFFIKNDIGDYTRIDDFYEKKIFKHVDIEKALEKTNLKIVDVFDNKDFAGARKFYCLAKID